MIRIIFFVYWLMMPLYFFPSGQMQISDIVLSFGFVLFFSWKLIKNQRLFAKMDTSLVLFIACVFLINTLYFILYNRSSIFMRSTIFYLFNLFLVIMFRELSQDRKFVKTLFYLCRINLIAQVIFYITGIGGNGGPRYVGTLNNPNQFAFFVFASFLVMYVISVSGKYSVKIRIIDYGMVLYLVILSASMGVLIGVTTLIVATLVFTIPKRKLPLIVSSLALGALLVFFLFDIDTDELFVTTRIEGRADATAVTFFEDRSLERVYLYPQYLLFGSGEGAHQRFGARTEMHSTWLSVVFYYGIIPFLILLTWMKGNLKNMDIKYLPVIIAIIVDSVGRITQRQPFIWAILILIYLCNNTQEKGQEIGLRGAPPPFFGPGRLRSRADRVPQAHIAPRKGHTH